MVNIALKELQNSLNIWVNRLVMKQFAAQPPPLFYLLILGPNSIMDAVFEVVVIVLNSGLVLI